MNNKVVLVILISLLDLLLIRECESRYINVSDKEADCFSQNKVYDSDSDKCFKLLTQGSCEPGYWYVLERPEFSPGEDPQDLKIRGVCMKEKCPEGDYYWIKTQSCVQPQDKKKLCGNSSDEELLNNFFGEAECVCARDPLRARYNGDESSPCYQLYTQGPCQLGQVIAYTADNLEKAVCVHDACHEETIRRKRLGTLSQYGVLAPWTNGSCYELGTQGPCSDTVKFKIHETTLQPQCVTLTNAIFDLEKPQTCFQDENGDCQKRINKAQNASKYKGELLAALNSAKRKRSLRTSRRF